MSLVHVLTIEQHARKMFIWTISPAKQNNNKREQKPPSHLGENHSLRCVSVMSTHAQRIS